MPQLAIVADDLTGAADTSASFADAGYATQLPFIEPPFPTVDVLVLSTESRDLPAAEAARTVLAAVRSVNLPAAHAPRWVYKKIDSALRGHPRDELLAAMDACSVTRALVAPALPAEGRTTRDGRQFINGVPISNTLFRGATTVLELFANERGIPVIHLPLERTQQEPQAVAALLASDTPGIFIADAETDADLDSLAQIAASSHFRVLCGAAGFARRLAPVLPLGGGRVHLPRPRGNQPVLVVAGSQHVATARQIAAMGDSGAPVVRLSQEVIDDPSSAIGDVVAEIATHLGAGRTTVVTTAGLRLSSSGERNVAARLASIATADAVVGHAGGMVLTGGDVAAAVCSALGATGLRLGGEIYAGQPWGRLEGGRQPGLPVATKAGSFGRDTAMFTCTAFLRGHGARG